jgi:hypothetical protein
MAGPFLTEISSTAVIPAKAGIQVSLVIDTARKLRSPAGATLVAVRRAETLGVFIDPAINMNN